MTIRILGGRFGGMRLRSVKGRATRPLTGRAKEALFQLLADRLAGARVWDLFAGTGATGLEAFSRGAVSVLFVERGRAALSVLERNVALVTARARAQGLEAALEIRRGDAWRPPPGPAPDLVFVDPPYDELRRDPLGRLEDVAALAAALAPGGRLVLHHPAGLLDETALARLPLAGLRRYGGAALALIAPPERR